jgi:hypothetical protein
MCISITIFPQKLIGIETESLIRGGLRIECCAETRLLEFCSSVQDEGGVVDLIMDLPTENTETTAMAKLEPLETSSGPDVSAIPSSLSGVGVHSPETPSWLGTRRKSCAFNCYCRCHSDDGEDMPHLPLKRNVTVLSLITRTRRQCSEPRCQRIVQHRTNKLVLPSSYFCKALACFVNSRSWTVKHHLNTYRMVPETCDSMRYAKHGDLKNLKACIESGEATPFDTVPDGWSLLHVS